MTIFLNPQKSQRDCKRDFNTSPSCPVPPLCCEALTLLGVLGLSALQRFQKLPEYISIFQKSPFTREYVEFVYVTSIFPEDAPL